MSLTDKTAHGQTDSLTFELELSHAPEKVWRALTEPALVSQWLLPMLGELSPGGAFRFKTDPHPGWDGTVDCRVLTLEAQKKLSYTWVVGPMLDTVVTFELSPTPSGTRLSLVQSGFKENQKQNWGGARYGWRLMGGKLIELLGRTA